MRFLALIIFAIFSLCSASQAADFQKKFDLLGIGLAEIDIIATVDDEFVKRNLSVPYNFRKGSMHNVDLKTLKQLEQDVPNKVVTPGGIVASVLFNFTNLGGKASFHSSLNEDAYGKCMVRSMQDFGINIVTDINEENVATPLNLIFVTPDGANTVLAYRPSDKIITQKDLRYHHIKDYKAIVADASSWDNPSSGKAILRAFITAKKVKTKSVFLLSNAMFVKKYKEDLLKFIHKIDIVFSSEREVLELTGKSSVEDAISIVQKYNNLFIITRGEKGATIVNGNYIYNIARHPIPGGILVDKSGADAAFAAGFLFGYLNGKSIESSGALASKNAANILSQIGRKPKTKVTSDEQQ